MTNEHIKQELRMFAIDLGIAKQETTFGKEVFDKMVENSTNNILNRTNKPYDI